MVALFNDESRKERFEILARQNGVSSLLESCKVDLLEWSPGANDGWRSHETDVKALRSRDKRRLQIIFAPLDSTYHRAYAGTLALYELFAIPSEFISHGLESVTHSFGATRDESSCSAWFHFLCKHLTVNNVVGKPPQIGHPGSAELSHGDWTWIRTRVFMRWSGRHDKDRSSVAMVIFSASPELRDRCQRLQEVDRNQILEDPFSLFAICLDELWLQAQGTVYVIQRVFGEMERTALELTVAKDSERRNGHHDFVGLHNTAKHIIHLKEGAEAALLTASHLQDYHHEILQEVPPGSPTALSARQTSRMLAQRVVQCEVWQLRMASLQQRMQNVINLSFNNVTQNDSHIMKQDSRSMKAIAVVTVAFLPLATVAAVFGSQFFNFDSSNRRILVAKNFWIFWVLIGPLSLLVLLSYRYFGHLRGLGWDDRSFARNPKSL